jgi:hypothetical protein
MERITRQACLILQEISDKLAEQAIISTSKKMLT